MTPLARHRPILLLLLLVLLACRPATGRGTASGSLTILAISPAPRVTHAPAGSQITIQFDRPVVRASINSDTFWAFGRWSGSSVGGSYSFSNNDQTVTLTPARPFSAGEQVMVLLSNQIQATDSTFLRSSGYSYQFWLAAAPAGLDFSVIDTLEVRSNPNISTRAYGGTATDFNNDGWLDITVVNEDTADLRVFLNRADGSGYYHPFLEPPTPVNQRASPNEPSDFNRDGWADLAVANIDTNSISILLGNGDGTFGPQQEVSVGSLPRGIAVLDVDGDGDTDIVNTNSGGQGNLSLLRNDGQGLFGPAEFFEGGGISEWALAAADMDEDFLLDLVIGGRNVSDPQIIVNRSQGDGSFSFVSSTPAGGAVWMLNSGDLNGDGHEDVATANSANNNGAILRGDGTGQLGSPVTYPTDIFPLATDLGDIDGDGDLDWVTSSFSGDWQLFLNDAQASFHLALEFPATAAASCALMLDIDNDGDLDLALIDEIADEVQLVRENSVPPVVTYGLLLPFIRRN